MVRLMYIYAHNTDANDNANDNGNGRHHGNNTLMAIVIIWLHCCTYPYIRTLETMTAMTTPVAMTRTITIIQ